jgi:hypothetical protein
VQKLTVGRHFNAVAFASSDANDGTQLTKQSAEIPKTRSSYIAIAIQLYQHRHQSLQKYTPVPFPLPPTFNLILYYKEVYLLVSLLIATLSDAGGASHVIARDINDVNQGWKNNVA